MFCTAARIYAKECEHEDPIYKLLGKLLGVKFKRVVDAPKANSKQRATVADALFCTEIEDTEFGKKNAVAIYLELKNGLSLSRDGGLQATLSLRKHITQDAVSHL